MDYEKEYKSLVAKVKKAHQFAQTDSTKSVLEDILPQLRESEELLDAHNIVVNLPELKFYGGIKDKNRELIKNPEEAANNYLDGVYGKMPHSDLHIAIFIAGAKWDREQMMKDAVEADVNIYRDLAAGKSWAEFVVEMPTNNLGDKVRVIVLPKED